MNVSCVRYSEEGNAVIVRIEHELGPVKVVVEKCSFLGKKLSPDLQERAVQIQLPVILERLKLYLSVYHCKEVHFYLSDFPPLAFGWDWDGPTSQALHLKFAQQDRKMSDVVCSEN